jgi:hypothetical protein
MPTIPSGVLSQLISEKSLPASRRKAMLAPLAAAFTLALALAFAAGPAGMAAAQSPAPQPLHYWHVWVDSAGTTHQTQCEFKDFSPLSLGKGVEPIFVDRLPDTPAHVVIAQFPKGWVGQWHENPAPQWIIPLSGRWFVETMDGHRVEMEPGDASLGENQGSKPDAAGHVGHLSGTLGDAHITLMFVQLDHKVTLNDACWNK